MTAATTEIADAHHAVIVYTRSRMHRNTIDAAITERDLRADDAVLISVTDYTEDTPIGDLVGTVLDAVNE
ncbi:recombinase family protein [Actinoallomurus iriomotensis]|uniref:Resolvase/invertase-type recombinase catalytic domain-containing protein n=1 Tax=Actinoallomurus iriomotensis TaxID=478107 RepID=A0A9W6RN26_9ACTN|nr:recombinase family protein [Actinoallomurus iriomotensis]GLY78509.1 hypothetical protein Airi01_067760 [Actinoallomurus iriomotensis]